MPILSLRVAALLSCVLVAAACQTPPPTVAASDIAPRLVAVPDVPLAGMATMRAAEISPRHVRFDVADHRIAMRLPDGFCEIGDHAPAGILKTLQSSFKKQSFEISSLALPCAIMTGRQKASLPLAMTLIGQMMDDGAPLILTSDRMDTFDMLVRMLHPENGSAAGRQLVMESFIEGFEKSGNKVEHFDAVSSNGHIRGRLLMREGREAVAGNWVFMDMVVARISDRVLGVGVINVSRQPAPPDIKDDSEGMFAALRQVRN